jgi:hypothetical protein
MADIHCGYVANDIVAVVDDGNARQALFVHFGEGVGKRFIGATQDLVRGEWVKGGKGGIGPTENLLPLT